MKTYDLTAIMPEHHAFLFATHYPEFIDKIIGVKLKQQWNFQLDKDLSVKQTENIMTLLLLPIAATLSNNIHLLGFDGKSPDQTDYFWKHHNKFQYVELLKDIQAEHASFFEDRDFGLYSENHEKTISSIFLKFENAGIQIQSHSKSFIQAINERN